CPYILNRSSWDAQPYISREKLKTLPVAHIVIRQLPASNSIVNQQDCIKTIKDLQDSQMKQRGWADIGYNFLLCSDSDDQQQIYRGRGWAYVGAHCIGYNFKSLGIGLIGNYATEKSLNAFKSLIQCGITKNDIVKNFTMVGYSSSSDIYEYYLKYFRNDSDLHYSNQISGTQFFCG
ncbi:unnamed protein product, partial [Rotaria socialis]